MQIAGYGVYRGGALIATTMTPAFTFAGRSCETSCAAGVDAFNPAAIGC